MKKSHEPVIDVLQNKFTQKWLELNFHYQLDLGGMTIKLPILSNIKTQPHDNYSLKYKARVLCNMHTKSISDQTVEGSDRLCTPTSGVTVHCTKIAFDTLVNSQPLNIRSIIMTLAAGFCWFCNDMV